jgi:argininosuccinate synthase
MLRLLAPRSPFVPFDPNILSALPGSQKCPARATARRENVAGTVRLTLYKGSARVVGRRSPKSLYSLAHVTFEEDAVYDQRDADGFIKLNSLRLRLAARRGR